jgi:hypothetical protein
VLTWTEGACAMTDEEAHRLWAFADSLLEFWAPLNTLSKYMKLGLTRAVKAETQFEHAMPQWKNIGKHMKAMKSRTEPLMKRTQKEGLAWLKLSNTKKGDIKKVYGDIDRYYKAFKKIMEPIEAIQREFDAMDDELKMEVRGSLDIKKYYNLVKYSMTSKKRVVKSYAKLRAA